MLRESNKGPQRKFQIDEALWTQALTLDRAVYTSPLRPFPVRTAPNETITHGLISPQPNLEPLVLLPVTLAHYQRNRTAFIPLPDGSNRTFAEYETLACKPELSFDQVLNRLHAIGTSGYLGEMLSSLNVVRLIQYGVRVSAIPGRYRTLTSGFEYGVFNSSHPSVIGVEMRHLGERADFVARQIKEDAVSLRESKIDDLRKKLAGSRFCDSEIVEQLTNKELLAYLAASETQRITAYIHPWYERIGRTTEEGMAVFALRAGVKPLFLSTPENRSTIAGYERGIVNAITALGFLREIGKRLGVSEDQAGGIFNTHDLYQRLSLPGLKKAIYESPLRFALGRNIFPDEEIMKSYYRETHTIIVGLINTFDVATLINDPYSLYTAGHLIGRGKTRCN